MNVQTDAERASEVCCAVRALVSVVPSQYFIIEEVRNKTGETNFRLNSVIYTMSNIKS